MDEQRDVERERELPDFERDDERTVGGGLMSEGGTATDRGTGELTGMAQGELDEDEDEAAEDEADDVRGVPIVPAAAAGSGGAPFVAAAIDDDDHDRDTADDR